MVLGLTVLDLETGLSAVRYFWEVIQQVELREGDRPNKGWTKEWVTHVGNWAPLWGPTGQLYRMCLRIDPPRGRECVCDSGYPWDGIPDASQAS